MQKNIITFLLLLITGCIAAQQQSFPFFYNMTGDRKIFADTCILRIAPSATAATSDTLFLGNDISVLMQVPFSEQRNNIASPWLKITYKKNGYTKVAFISAMDVSINDKASTKDAEFVWGLVSNQKSDSLINQNESVYLNHYTGKIKVKANNKWVEDIVDMPAAMKVDTVVSNLFCKTKLNHSKGVFQIELTATNNKSLVYQYNYILCNNYKLAALETINSIQKTQIGLKPIKSFYKYYSNKIVFMMSGFMDGDKEIESYKIKNCNIIKQ